MKNVKILLVFVAAVAILSGCNKEYTEPTIAWEGSLSAMVGFEDETNYDVDLAITFGAEAGISEIEVWKHIYEGLDVTSVTLIAPTGYDALTTFDYNFVADNSIDDFNGGVTKVVYEFIVTDSELQTETAEYTIFVIEAYSVTFNIVDADAAAIADAIVTFNGVANDAGVYVFNQIETGTYGYTIAKDGYETVTVTDYVLGEADATIDVTLVQSLPTTWTGPVLLALQGQQSWATYESNPVTIYESDLIGTGFTYTDGTTVRITTTASCEGWVVVDDVTGMSIYQDVVDAYTAGTAVTQLDLDFDQRAYAEKYYVAKIGTDYVLVHYILGHRDASNGNVVGFEYKTEM